MHVIAQLYNKNALWQKVLFKAVFAVIFIFATISDQGRLLTLLHSEWPKLHRVLAVLSAIGLKERMFSPEILFPLFIADTVDPYLDRFIATG